MVLVNLEEKGYKGHRDSEDDQENLDNPVNRERLEVREVVDRQVCLAHGEHLGNLENRVVLDR